MRSSNRLSEKVNAASNDRGGGGGTTDGKQAVEASVSGHLKRQAYGPERKLRRWIYVPGYSATRWVSPRQRVIVAQKKGETK